MNLKDIGNRIKYIRINKTNYSQEDFAKILGMDKTYYCRIENGKQNLTILNLIKICSCLHIELSDFFDLQNYQIIEEKINENN